MPIDQKQLVKPIRKLRKAVKKLPKVPSPEQVHGLRTQSRRLEASLHALNLDQTKHGQCLLKYIAPIRKAAGKVRDMDVLTGLASTIPLGAKDSGEDAVQLLEQLGADRLRFAKRLHQVVAGKRKRVLRGLKRFFARIDRRIENTQTSKAADQPGRADPTAFVISRTGAVSAWKKLDRNNLHPYRLHIKELRYVLELAQDPDARLLGALGQTKDAIGEWHDWCELESLARELLDGRDLVRKIHLIADQRFSKALKLATDLQRRYFQAERDPRHKGARVLRFKEPILISAARTSA